MRPVARLREPMTLENVAAGIRFVFRQKIILATITLDLFAVLFGLEIEKVKAAVRREFEAS